MRIGKALFGVTVSLFATALGMVIAAYLAILAFNWNDQPPAASAQRFAALYMGREPVADSDNGYVYAMGFAVGPGEDPRQAGITRLAWTHRMVGGGHGPSEQDPFGLDYDFKAGRSPAVAELSAACSTAGAECAATLAIDEKAVSNWLASEKWLLDRYRALLTHPGWLETAPLDIRVPFPSYSAVLEGQKLLLVRAWLVAGRGDAVGVRELLGEDVRFWRRALAASDNLLSKMIAVTALKRHFSGANLVLARLPADATMSAVPQPWMSELSRAERSMTRSLAGEWMLFDKGMRDIETLGADLLLMAEAPAEQPLAARLSSRALFPLLQPQDSSNRQAEMLMAIAETLDAPYEQFSEAAERARAAYRDAIEAPPPRGRMYNPVGNILFSIASPDFAHYAIRVADLEGVRRLAVLTARLRSHGFSGEQIPAQLLEAPVRNPYTGEPFLWDQGAGAIVFRGLEAGERGTHAFVY